MSNIKPRDFLKDLKSTFETLDRAEQVEKAANPEQAVSLKSLRTKGGEAPEAMKRATTDEALSKSFEDACRASKDFQRLGFGTDRALQEPRSFLRQKDNSGNYVVKNHQLNKLIDTLRAAGSNATSKPKGVSLDEWAGRGMADAISYKLGGAIGGAVADQAIASRIQKDLSSTSGTSAGQGGYLIRTDLEPVLYEAYLRKFPLVEQLQTEPANGIVHTYNVRTAPPAATTVSELGSIASAFSNSTFAQRQSSIAVIVAPVGVGLKYQYAVQQSGMPYDVAGSNNLEVMGALTGIAKKEQALFGQGNASTASKTLNDEEGLTDANGFDGLRTLLKGASYSITKASTDGYVYTINRAVGQLINAGADEESLMLIASLGGLSAINLELLQFLRDVNGGNNSFNGARMSGDGRLKTLSGYDVQLSPIPAAAQADGLGYYTYSGSTTEDIYVIDPNSISRVYLGSPTPTILELPIGYNNYLSNVYIPFIMSGLALKLPEFNRKIRIPQVTL